MTQPRAAAAAAAANAAAAALALRVALVGIVLLQVAVAAHLVLGPRDAGLARGHAPPQLLLHGQVGERGHGQRQQQHRQLGLHGQAGAQVHHEDGHGLPPVVDGEDEVLPLFVLIQDPQQRGESGLVEAAAYTPEGGGYVEDPDVFQDPRFGGPEKEAESEQQVQSRPRQQGHLARQP